MCFQKLYRPKNVSSRIFLMKAQNVLQEALAELDPTLIQGQPTFLVDLATTHFLQGEREAACGRAVEASILATQIKLQKVMQRLFVLRQKMGSWNDTQSVQSSDQHLTSSLTA